MGYYSESVREVKIRIPSPGDFVYGEFGEHLLKAYKEFLLATASVLHKHVEKIEEFEKLVEERKRGET